MRFYITILLFVFFSQLGAKTLYPKGEIIDSVHCKDYPEQSYALYLPSNYDPTYKWPVVFIYEPAARGSLPIKFMKHAAEKYGYILISSNNSRNGSWDYIFNATEAMFADAEQRFNLDPDRYYTAGFSGGSRGALAVAVSTGKIRGVIACAGGLPSAPKFHPRYGNSFVYFAIVGDKDMNNREHMKLKEKLSKIGIRNRVLCFDAGHTWPGEKEFGRAFDWLELQRRLDDSENSSFAQHYLLSEKSMIEESIEKGQCLQAAFYYQQLKDDLPKNISSPILDRKISEMLDSREYKDQLKRYEKSIEKEDELIDRYLSAFPEFYKNKPDSLVKSDFTWWQNEIDQLKRWTKSRSVEKSDLAYRMLNLIGARSAESCFRMIREMKYENALRLNRLWVKTDSESVYANWHMAKVYSLLEDKNNALRYLDRAYELGMSRAESLQNTKEFEFIRDERKYKEILAKLRENG